MAAENTQDVVSDDLNYETWAPLVKARLMENGVWDVVENGVPPDPTKIPALASIINVVDLARWRNRAIKDMKALKIMQSSLTDSAFRKTISVPSSKALWDLLRKGNEELKLARLENDFEKLSMYEEESMDTYLERVIDTVERLKRLGHARTDDEVITKLLTSLSWSYEGVPPVLEEIMALPDMTLHDLICIFDMFGSVPGEAVPHMLQDLLKSLAKAKSEQMWCGLCKKYNHNQEDCYYITKTVNPSVAPTATARRFRGQCYQCGERGHYVRDCNRRNQERNEKPEHLMLTVTIGGVTFDEDMWMIYTNASDHMTPYAKFFATLDRTYRARVGLADRRVIMAEGKGDVKIIMRGVKKTIKNVLFVPGIDRNVLSVGQMTSRGYTVIMGGGECVIKDETGNVFAKTVWEERGLALRLQVIEGGLIS